VDAAQASDSGFSPSRGGELLAGVHNPESEFLRDEVYDLIAQVLIEEAELLEKVVAS